MNRRGFMGSVLGLVGLGWFVRQQPTTAAPTLSPYDPHAYLPPILRQRARSWSLTQLSSTLDENGCMCVEVQYTLIFARDQDWQTIRHEAVRPMTRNINGQRMRCYTHSINIMHYGDTSLVLWGGQYREPL